MISFFFFFFNSLDPSEFTIFILSTSLFQDWNLIVSLLWALHWFSILHRINLQFWRLASRALLSSLLLTFTMSPISVLKHTSNWRSCSFTFNSWNLPQHFKPPVLCIYSSLCYLYLSLFHPSGYLWTSPDELKMFSIIFLNDINELIVSSTNLTVFTLALAFLSIGRREFFSIF